MIVIRKPPDPGPRIGDITIRRDPEPYRSRVGAADTPEKTRFFGILRYVYVCGSTSYRKSPFLPIIAVGEHAGRVRRSSRIYKRSPKDREG